MNSNGNALTYLGYTMVWKNGKLSISLSKKKLARYKNRILQSFEDYNRQKFTNKKRSTKIACQKNSISDFKHTTS